jgi:transposase
MATERLLMRHIREILRLKWTLRRSHRETARSLGISAGAVASVVTRAKATGLTWDTVGALSDDALERTLYGPKLARPSPGPGPIWSGWHTELRRPGVTLELLHLEYLAVHPDGYRYSAFCGHYRRWLAQQRTSMRQVHTAGEKTFVDYAGQRPSLVDSVTGALADVELFCRRARRLQLHLRRGHPHAAQRRFHPESHADRGVLGWRLRGGRAGSTADRRHRSLPV